MDRTGTLARAGALALALATVTAASPLTERDRRFVATYRKAVATAQRGERAAAYRAFRHLVGTLPELSPALQAKVRPRLDRALVTLAPALAAELPESRGTPEAPGAPVLVVGEYREPAPLPIETGTMLVVNAPRSSTPAPAGPPPAILETFAAAAEARGDLVEAFRHRLRRYIAQPDDAAGCKLSRVADAYAGEDLVRRHLIRRFFSDLLEHEPDIADCLRALAGAPTWQEPVLEISAGHLPGQPEPTVYTYAQLVGAEPDTPRAPFTGERPRFLSDIEADQVLVAANEVLDLRRSSGPEPAFHRAVDVVRVLRDTLARSWTVDLPVLVWRGDPSHVPPLRRSAMPPLSYHRPRQGAAALKAWLERDREGAVAGLQRTVRVRSWGSRALVSEVLRPQPSPPVVLASLTAPVPGQPREQPEGERWTSRKELLEQRLRTAEFDDPQVMQELLQTVEFSSPIVLDLPGGDGELSATGREDLGAAVLFDVDGTGEPALCQWLLPDGDAWLAEDTDGDGRITSGRELFGTADGHVNGWVKLAARDGDGDGQVSGAELAGLLLWRERRADGVSDPDELTPVEDAGLTSIALPASGLTSTARFGDEVRPAWDLFPTTWAAGPRLP